MAGLVLAAAPVQPAQAESAAQARAAAQEAAQKVRALQPKVDAALKAYQQALDDIAGNVSRSVEAERQAAVAAQAQAEQRRQVDQQARALYMSGGTVGLAASVLDASTPTDALRRVAYVQRLMQGTTARADSSGHQASAASSDAARLARLARRSIVVADDVSRRYDDLTATLADAAAALSSLSARARHLTAAAEAAKRLRELAAAAAASAAARVATAKAGPVPPEYKLLYVAAAKTCSGLSWTVLAAIGQVESGHGRNNGPSSAGARGPMQFLPSTFAAYAVDGDHDGITDIDNPADAIFTAAHYLCANGAGRGGSALYNAIFHYNHADWYVQLVLRIAAQLAGPPPA